MRILIAVLAIVATVFGFLYLQSTQRSVVIAPPASLVVTQLVERPAITAEVERAVTVLVTNTAELEARLSGLASNLAQSTESLKTEEARSAALDRQRDQLQNQLRVVSNQLVQVRQEYRELQATHNADRQELHQLQDRQTGLIYAKAVLEQEKASLEQRLNNLAELRAQIHLLKQQAHARRLAEWKQADAADGVGGNRGFLKLRGHWTAGPTRPSQPN